MENEKTEIGLFHGASITYAYQENLYINMTNLCPNRCDFCLRQNSSGSLYATNLWYQDGEPTRQEIWAQLQRRDLNRYMEIVFCGYGEPACRWDDMMWLCDQIRACGSHFIRLNTNGLANLITGRNAALELDGRFDAVSVSLNASTAEGYDAICHSRFGLQAFPAILRFTSTAVLNVPHVRMTVVSTMPKAEQDACRQIAESVGADFFVREYIAS
ncbi:TatD family nuclease-associated radical SAM protein [Acutalibacter caecimuris]|uniref:TatD family nuclease-associated radical SAM protein n=1 Tax=Acutalibacter caecimuris TaxID=3093657 RepID=UPI002AC945C4|nr:TatD family nuclease-associated radical SAM protein [Acutalibacter sp. M00118]